MHIRVIVPVLDSKELVGKALLEYRSFASAGTTVSAVPLKRGTRSIESDFDSTLAAPEVMRLAREAEADGVDACTIACFTDPGLVGARELTSIPILGEGEAALHAATMLAGRFMVVITERSCFPMIRRTVARYGFSDRLVTVREAGAGVLSLTEDCVPRILEECIDGVARDGAEAVVMGCTGTGFDMAERIETGLREHFKCHIPVIDPGKVAMKFAEGFAAMKLRPSKLAFPPPAVDRPEYEFA